MKNKIPCCPHCLNDCWSQRLVTQRVKLSFETTLCPRHSVIYSYIIFAWSPFSVIFKRHHCDGSTLFWAFCHYCCYYVRLCVR